MIRYILILLLFISCGSEKKLIKDKTKTKSEVVDSGEIKIKRPSDSLEVEIPKDIPKNTTIEKRGKNSVIYIKSDDKGNIKVLSKCDSLDIYNKWYKTHKIEENKNVREKEKETIIKPIFLLYLFIGLAFLMLVKKILDKFV